MRRMMTVPACCAAVVVVTLGAGGTGAGGQPATGRHVAKTTIAAAPTAPAPTAPGSTVAVPTAPAPTLPPPTVPLPTLPLPTLPLPTVPMPTVAVAPVPSATVVAPGPATTEVAGLSPESLAIALPVFGLDPARLQCVDAALPPLGSDDDQAFAVLQGCGVAVMPLLRGIVAVAQASTTFLDPTATTVALPPVSGIEILAPEDAFYLGFMVLIDSETVSCLATGLTGATAEDDGTAVAILQRCEVSIAFTLDMLTFALVGDFDVEPAPTVPAPTVTAPTVPAPTVSVAPPTLSVAHDDPLVDEFQAALLEEQGITLDDAQAACLLGHVGGGSVDTDDIAALLALLESCGITLSDLVPSDLAGLAGALTAGSSAAAAP